jgi:hypothetical protein
MNTKVLRTVYLASAGLMGVIAGVHLQQYIQFMSLVPTIGWLFLLNAAGGTSLMVMLALGNSPTRLAASFGGLGLALGSLVSIIITLHTSLFGYHEPTLRAAIVIAIVSEILIIPFLSYISLSEFKK